MRGRVGVMKEDTMKKLVGALVCAMLTVPMAAQAQDGPVVKGSLDKDVVRKVIKKNVGKVAWCYERGLTRDPSLEGKVVVEFVVGKKGKVESTVIKRSTMGDAKVEGCIADKVKAFVFPGPKGGGVAIVQYPFVFESADEEKDAIHALGNLEGSDATSGFGGLGLSGTGRTGTEVESIGLGSLGKAGTAGEPAKAKTKIVPGKPVVKGSLDKEIIRRVVRQHRNEIRYCYEKQLQKKPDLAGKVVVKFVVSATGKVQSAVVAETTLKDEAVEGCVTKRVRRWTFPEPKGGGIVVVKYPFLFSSK